MTGSPGDVDRTAGHCTDHPTEHPDGSSSPFAPGRLTADGRHPVLVPENWGEHLNPSEWALGGDGLPFRAAARVLVVTRDGDILLLVGHDAADPGHSWVFTPGGGLRPGEEPRAGAVRELAEESGIDVAPTDLEGPVAHREAVFRFASVTCRQDETFFLLRLPTRHAVGKEGWTALERDVVDSIAWWSPEELRAAQERGQEIYPVRLPALVDELASGWSGEPLDLTDPVDAEILAALTAASAPHDHHDHQGPR
ncbi:NUDIX domain-containing protein [Actinomyces viscosus]|uniref:RNA pyrophosphohydrolase n=1 Tax=Actinomyces viscosus TaxID=1656 RepID=A0A3S4V160_ACTVI|nr:NUDIX domain-containing protein [Actinomyces viscosus]VEI14795.1 RNA pyrophosphohydrolase [Actinomyces viscosus]